MGQLEGYTTKKLERINNTSLELLIREDHLHYMILIDDEVAVGGDCGTKEPYDITEDALHNYDVLRDRQMEEQKRTFHQWKFYDHRPEGVAVGTLSSQQCEERHMKLYVPVTGHFRNKRGPLVPIEKNVLLQAVTKAMNREAFQEANHVTIQFQGVHHNHDAVDHVMQHLQTDHGVTDTTTDTMDIQLQANQIASVGFDKVIQQLSTEQDQQMT